MKKLFYVITAFIIIVAACSTPATRIYSLYLPHEEPQSTDLKDTKLAIEASGSKYLRQSFIAVRVSSYELVLLPYAKWESAPVKMIAREFKKDPLFTKNFGDIVIKRTLSEETYGLKVNVSRFERVDEGELSYALMEFEADFFSPHGKKLFHQRIYEKIILSDSNSTELARTLSEELGKAIRKIALSVEQKLNN